MIILGIDPGTATTGFGLISYNYPVYEVIDWGLIETKKDSSPEVRLAKIYQEMLSIIELYKPDVLAMEMLFFATNAKTAIKVGQAQGVIMLSASAFNKEVVQYAPGTIKKVISGDGRADKIKMQKAVRKHLGSFVKSEKNKKTHFDNAADALAIALCHIFSIK
ncbi:crossover junction endodeoxyribonuclease RuvC [Candidatus Woesebacteria bacterium]|nr:crossover junction endodeoxyribonuclease RuvC [Candidatus Woesebacteria bacterium]QQG47167.1 MAG: crossover junction endodeoxyribonuclease RuvC [Candidatus Woesebacteria bacterium]